MPPSNIGGLSPFHAADFHRQFKPLATYLAASLSESRKAAQGLSGNTARGLPSAPNIRGRMPAPKAIPHPGSARRKRPREGARLSGRPFVRRRSSSGWQSTSDREPHIGEGEQQSQSRANWEYRVREDLAEAHRCLHRIETMRSGGGRFPTFDPRHGPGRTAELRLSYQPSVAIPLCLAESPRGGVLGAAASA